jgi:hypothetical protein
MDKVLTIESANLVAYWPLNETSGTTADNYEGTAARDGTYSSDVSSIGTTTGIGDGNTAPNLDGTNDYIDVVTVSLQSAFDPNDGTISLWTKLASGTWTDSSVDHWFTVHISSSNQIWIRKTNTNNQYQYYHEGNNTPIFEGVTGASTAWRHYCMVWSVSGDYLKLYVDGSQVGATQTGLDTFSGTPTIMLIGAQNTTPVSPMTGAIAHVSLWTTQVGESDIASLATL